MNPAIDLHVDRWGRGERALLVHGSFSYGALAFSEQRPLAERWRLDVVDRRGFGVSPDRAGRVDFEEDAADVAALLDEPAHLVGHSYGGIVALLAAALRPDAVRSVTAIEPPAFGLAPGVSAVEAMTERIATVFVQEAGSTEEAFLEAFLRAWGLDPAPIPRLSDAARRSVRASMTERMPSEAEIPLAALRASGVPVLVVRGAWDAAPAVARALARPAFGAVCDVVERELGAQAAVFPGASHSPQALGAPFNERVERFWRGSTQPAGISWPAPACR